MWAEWGPGIGERAKKRESKHWPTSEECKSEKVACPEHSIIGLLMWIHDFGYKTLEF